MKKPATGSAASRMVRGLSATVRFLRRLLLLTVMAVLVLTLGVDVAPPPPAPAARPTVTDAARTAARSSAMKLAVQARQLAAAAATEQSRARFSSAASLLLLQTDLLHRESPAGIGESHLSSPESLAGTPPRVSIGQFVAGLVESGQANLRSARYVDPGEARLLASVGTSQTVLARNLARATGLTTPGQIPEAAGKGHPEPTPDGDPMPSPPTAGCAVGTTASAEETDGARTVDALLLAADAERRVVYAYEVSAARLDGTTDDAAKMLAGHRLAAAQGADLAAALCAEGQPRVPAYVLPAVFRSEPRAVLAQAEEQLSASYAELISLSEGEIRDWAIARLAVTAENAALWSGAVAVAPGLMEAVDPRGVREARFLSPVE